MISLDIPRADSRRDYVLAEFRCALVKAKLAQLEIETIAIALKGNLVSPEQAMVMFCDSEPIAFLGIEVPA